VRSFVAECPIPLVIDADGLNAFAGQKRLLSGSERPLVLTPHPGEMARITGQRVSEIENNRIETARSFAREHQLILVLKGWRTLIANPDGHIWVNTTGNPGLAKGGSGDVLTGLVAGLMAQFADSIPDAVRAAVYLHGMAADLVLEGQTMQTMLATDLLPKLSAALLLTTSPTAQQIFGVEGDFTLIQRGFETR
jgi:NAD(P)H-hydrate epimerase